jgi:hypothetical protein
MDSFKEQIVKKENTQRDSVKRVFIMIGSIALACALFLIVLTISANYVMIGVLLAGVSLYVGFYMLQNMDIEYEYIFTNGDLDIDKIIAQRNRKRLVTIKVNDAVAVGEVDDSFSVDSDKTLVYASACSGEYKDYYINVKHKSLGDTTLVFSPDEDMLRMIKTHLPRTLRNNIRVSDKPINLNKDDE